MTVLAGRPAVSKAPLPTPAVKAPRPVKAPPVRTGLAKVAGALAAPKPAPAAPNPLATPQPKPAAVSISRQRATALAPGWQPKPAAAQPVQAIQAVQDAPPSVYQTNPVMAGQGNQYHVIPHGKPLFTHEGNYHAAYQFFAQYAKPGPYITALNPQQQQQFNSWAAQYKVPITRDYDMQGYWLANGSKPYNGSTHFPDTYKTPYDTTFSRESKYSANNNPFDWVGNKLINVHTGQIIFAGSD